MTASRDDTTPEGSRPVSAFWPHASDYNAAVQNPAACFADADLRQGQAMTGPLGLPVPYSGNFADVYRIDGADKRSWAVKCFTKRVADLQRRYQAVSDHLLRHPRPFMVDCRFLEQGIRVRNQWFPVV